MPSITASHSSAVAVYGRRRARDCGIGNDDVGSCADGCLCDISGICVRIGIDDMEGGRICGIGNGVHGVGLICDGVNGVDRICDMCGMAGGCVEEGV